VLGWTTRRGTDGGRGDCSRLAADDPHLPPPLSMGGGGEQAPPEVGAAERGTRRRFAVGPTARAAIDPFATSATRERVRLSDRHTPRHSEPAGEESLPATSRFKLNGEIPLLDDCRARTGGVAAEPGDKSPG